MRTAAVRDATSSPWPTAQRAGGPGRTMPITAPASLADITDPRLAKDIADPALSELPTLKAENADAIDPIDPTEPTEPIDRADPRLAMDRKESSEARDHVEGMSPAW